MQRIRTIGDANAFFWDSGTRTCVNIDTGKTIDWFSAGLPAVRINTGFPYSWMSDVSDNPNGPNDVDHDKREFYVPPGELTTEGPPVNLGGSDGICKHVYKYRLPPSVALSLDSHLGGLSGIKALAIARVPAYSAKQMEGFISLIESREMVDLTALKAAGALAGFAANAYKSIKGGGTLKRFLSREAKRALERLKGGFRKKLSINTSKELWNEFLTGMRTLSSVNMEWKYGIKPIISDIHAANAAVASLGKLRAQLLLGERVYGRVREVRTDSGVQSSGALFEYTTSLGRIGNYSVEWEKETKTTAVASVRRRLAAHSAHLDTVDWFTSLDMVMEINGLNPSASRIWQTMPLSFVTDWFYNIGDLLESLQTVKRPIGTEIESVDPLYSVKTETTVTGRGNFQAEATPSDHAIAAHHVSYSRHTDPLTGGPVLYIPPLHLPTKAGQWFSMAQIAFETYMGRKKH